MGFRDPLAILEMFGAVMLLAVFVCACCGYCIRGKSTQLGEVLSTPNPNTSVTGNPGTQSVSQRSFFRTLSDQFLLPLRVHLPQQRDGARNHPQGDPNFNLPSHPNYQTSYIVAEIPSAPMEDMELGLPIINDDPPPPYPGPPPGETCI